MVTHSSSPSNDKPMEREKISVMGIKRVGTEYDFCVRVEERVEWKKR